MTRLELIKYEITSLLKDGRVRYQLYNSIDGFVIDCSFASIRYDGQTDGILFKFNTTISYKIVIGFEKKLSNIDELKAYIKYYLVQTQNRIHFEMVLMSLFITNNLGIEGYYVRIENRQEEGLLYVVFVIDKYDYIEISIVKDTIEVRNFGEASTVEWGFYTVEPILVTHKLDDVFLYLLDNMENKMPLSSNHISLFEPKEWELLKYEVASYFSEKKMGFELHKAKDTFKIGIAPSISVTCGMDNGIIFKYKIHSSRKVEYEFEFEEQFEDVKDLLIYLKHYILLTCRPFYDTEFIITNFLKHKLGIDKYYVLKANNIEFDGVAYIHISFGEEDHVKISISKDNIEIRNFGEANNGEYGFYEIDPIFTSSNVDDVLLFLKENYTATK